MFAARQKLPHAALRPECGKSFAAMSAAQRCQQSYIRRVRSHVRTSCTGPALLVGRTVRCAQSLLHSLIRT